MNSNFNQFLQSAKENAVRYPSQSKILKVKEIKIDYQKRIITDIFSKIPRPTKPFLLRKEFRQADKPQKALTKEKMFKM